MEGEFPQNPYHSKLVFPKGSISGFGVNEITSSWGIRKVQWWLEPFSLVKIDTTLGRNVNHVGEEPSCVKRNKGKANVYVRCVCVLYNKQGRMIWKKLKCRSYGLKSWNGFRDYLVDFILYIRKIMRIITAATCEFCLHAFCEAVIDHASHGFFYFT